MAKMSIKRLLSLPAGHYFLFGPRGTGKSTWLKSQYSHCLMIDLLNPEIRRYYQAKPERLYETVTANSESKQIVIDEVEKVPELLTVVHSLIENNIAEQQFILTGSSSRKLKRTGVDLLGGRAVVKNLHSFTAMELKNSFLLSSALQIGLLPLIVNAQDPKEQLQGYITTYLQLEVQLEGFVRNLSDFTRFLETITFSHGCVLNISNIARECSIERKMVMGYISILEDLLLSFQIPVFSKRAKRQLIQHSKFYLFDAGIFFALRPHGFLDRIEEMQGPALEGLVAQHLRAWIDYSNKRAKLYFWRTKHGVEVDFIVYSETQLLAIEVKNARQVFPNDLRGLKIFHEDYPEAQLIMLYRGQERLLINNVLCLPCEDFLKNLNPARDILAADNE